MRVTYKRLQSDMQNGMKTPLKSFKINSMKSNLKKVLFMIIGKKLWPNSMPTVNNMKIKESLQVTSLWLAINYPFDIQTCRASSSKILILRICSAFLNNQFNYCHFFILDVLQEGLLYNIGQNALQGTHNRD